MKRPTETIANLLTATIGVNDFDTYVSISGTDTVVIASAEVVHYLWEHFYEWSMFTKGDTIDVMTAFGDNCYRITMFDSEVESIQLIDPVSAQRLETLDSVTIYPANMFVTTKERINTAVQQIYLDLGEPIRGQ